MTRQRDPAKNHNMASTRVNDKTRDELREIAAKSGETLAEVTRRAIMAGLPIVRRDLLKDK